MLYTTNSTTITGLDSRVYSMQSALIRSPGRPTGGWRAEFPIAGQKMIVEGRTPLEVYNGVVILLRRNNLSVSPLDVWLNLNVQWLNRTPAKYHIVGVADLMVSSKTEKSRSVVDSRRRSYKPSDWGQLAWGWLNIFLAREEFHYRDFLTQLKYVLDMLNPDTNAEIGCAECYRDFTIMVSKIGNRPTMSREEARKWLVDAHNEVSAKIKGKPILTFEQAAKAAFWT